MVPNNPMHVAQLITIPAFSTGRPSDSPSGVARSGSGLRQVPVQKSFDCPSPLFKDWPIRRRPLGRRLRLSTVLPQLLQFVRARPDPYGSNANTQMCDATHKPLLVR
ncbi:unnamed protein product [Ixodes pacificus]